jgi:hypothetical protein
MHGCKNAGAGQWPVSCSIMVEMALTWYLLLRVASGYGMPVDMPRDILRIFAYQNRDIGYTSQFRHLSR